MKFFISLTSWVFFSYFCIFFPSLSLPHSLFLIPLPMPPRSHLCLFSPFSSLWSLILSWILNPVFINVTHQPINFTSMNTPRAGVLKPYDLTPHNWPRSPLLSLFSVLTSRQCLKSIPHVVSSSVLMCLNDTQVFTEPVSALPQTLSVLLVDRSTHTHVHAHTYTCSLTHSLYLSFSVNNVQKHTWIKSRLWENVPDEEQAISLVLCVFPDLREPEWLEVTTDTPGWGRCCPRTSVTCSESPDRNPSTPQR